MASNADATVPAERGLLPGNGAALAFLRTATGAEPVVTGKPELAMHAESVRRSAARHPLIVGDRLDTDIEAGHRAACPTLLVLTGVTTVSELLVAPARHRPTYLAHDLRGLLRPQPVPRRDGDAWVCGGWRATADLTLSGDGDDLDALRALSAAAWAAGGVDRRAAAAAVKRLRL